MSTKAPKVIDLDAQLGLGGEADEPIYVKTVKIFGEEWRVVCDLSSFSLHNIMGGDASAGDVMLFLESMIHPEEWPRFRHVASLHPSLRGEDSSEKLYSIIRAIMEVAAERPTTPPSTLPRGGSNGSTVRRSAASTASGRAKVSKTSR